MESIEKQIEKGLKESEAQIVERIKENLIEKISHGYSWDMQCLTKETIETFYSEQIAPELVKLLCEQKGEIMKGVRNGAVGLGIAVGNALIKNAEESLSGYKAGEILKTLVS